MSPGASKLSIGGLLDANIPWVGGKAERKRFIEGNVPNVADVRFIATLGLPIIQVGLHLSVRGELHFANGRGVAVAALDIENANVGIEDPIVFVGDGNVGAGHWGAGIRGGQGNIEHGVRVIAHNPAFEIIGAESVGLAAGPALVIEGAHGSIRAAENQVNDLALRSMDQHGKADKM